MSHSSQSALKTTISGPSGNSRELAWPHDPDNLIDALFGDINRYQADCFTIARHENGCLSVRINPRESDPSPEMRGEGSNKLCNALTTGNRDTSGTHNPATICVGNDILREQTLQSGHVPLLCSADECL